MNTANVRKTTYALSNFAAPSVILTYTNPIVAPSGSLRRRSEGFRLFRKCVSGSVEEVRARDVATGLMTSASPASRLASRVAAEFVCSSSRLTTPILTHCTHALFTTLPVCRPLPHYPSSHTLIRRPSLVEQLFACISPTTQAI